MGHFWTRNFCVGHIGGVIFGQVIFGLVNLRWVTFGPVTFGKVTFGPNRLKMLVELHREGSALQPVQQTCFFTLLDRVVELAGGWSVIKYVCRTALVTPGLFSKDQWSKRWLT